MPNGDTFSTKFQRYCGFEWPGWFRVTIWTLAALLLSGIAIRDFLPIVHEYKYNNALTETSVIINNNDTVGTPQLALCIPYYSGALKHVTRWVFSHSDEIMQGKDPSTDDCVECEALKNRSWDVWMNMKFRRVLAFNPINELAPLFLKRVLEEDDFRVLILNTTDEHSRPNYAFWNQPIIDAVWIYIACWYARDQMFAGEGLAWLVYCRDVPLAEMDAVDKELLERMFNYTVNAVDVYMATEISVSDSPTLLTPSLQSREGFIPFTDKFCFGLTLNSTNEQYPFHRRDYHDWVPPNLPPWAKSNMEGRFEIYDLTTVDSLVDPDRALFKTNTTLVKDITWNVVTLVYSVENTVIEKRPDVHCSPDRVHTDCIARRQTQIAIDFCNCIPFAYRNLISHPIDLPYCSSTSYAECSDKMGRWEDKGDTLEKNVHECSRKCEYVFYKWKYTHRAGDGTFCISLKYGREDRPFMQFTLTTKTTLEQFIAQVGGVFGLYLGFSGLTAFALFLFLIDTLMRLRRSDYEPARADPTKRDSVSGLRMFWLTRMVQVGENQHVVSTVQQQMQVLRDEIREEIAEVKEELMEHVNEMKDNLDKGLREIKEVKMALHQILNVGKTNSGNE